MQTSENMSTPRDVHFDDTLAATRGRSNYYFSFATWPIGVGTPRTTPNSGIAALNQPSGPPYIPSASGCGSCARRSVVGWGTHVSNGGGKRSFTMLLQY